MYKITRDQSFLYWSYIIILLTIIVVTPCASGQHTCSTDELHQLKLRQDQVYMQRQIQADNYTYNQIKNSNQNSNQKSRYRLTTPTYILPVVVHIIHNGGAENISDALVHQAIADLNDAFEHVPPFDGPNGVDTKIQFCLATQDPDGHATTGINRVVSPLTNVDASSQDLALKDLIRWDPYHYINIWVVKEICRGGSCATAGYAYLAAAHGSTIDGIVCEAAWFGSSKDNSKVHIHEVGHYLNLYHTFEGGCPNGDCLTNGDKVCDTPPDNNSSSNPGCVADNSCSTDMDDTSPSNPFTSDINDQINNYMDYSGQACQNQFTQGQKERMSACIVGTRRSLLDSRACLPSCPSPFDVAFNASSLSIEPGDEINFTNLSTGTITGYEWYMDDALISTASTGISHTFLTEGVYSVKLKAFNSNPDCLPKEKAVLVTVKCPLETNFTLSATEVRTGTNVDLIYPHPTDGLNFKWYVNGVLVSTSSTTSHSFTTAGSYRVTLEIANDHCSKTSVKNIVVINTDGSCINMDFETGTTAYWLGYTGKATGLSTVLGDIIPGLSPTRHEIMTSGYDPIVGGSILPVVAPGGLFSLRLEDREPGANGSMIRQSFLVTPANASFTYKYAVVLENPGHTHAENPYFNVHMTDASGVDIPCATYSVIADPPFTGFSKVTDKEVYYKNWTTVVVPLTAYIGQNVTITFTVADCAWGGHFGYAYLDGSCLPLQITSSAKAVCAGETIKLDGPSGFDTYQWTGPGIVGASNTSSVSINTPGTYHLDVASSAGSTCKTSLSITISGTVTTIDAGPDQTICVGNTAQLLAKDGSIYHWTPSSTLSNANIHNPMASPLVTTTYTVTSCGASDQVTVHVIPNFTLDVTDDQTICANEASVGLQASPIPEAGSYQYSWSPSGFLSDSTTQTTIASLTESKKFYVHVKERNTGCYRKDSVSIKLLPGLTLAPSRTPDGLCHNSSVTSVTLNANPSATASVISWYEGESLIGSGSSISVHPKASTLYTVTAQDGACKSKATITVPYYQVNAGPDKIKCSDPLRLAGSDNADTESCNYTLATIPFQSLYPDNTWTKISLGNDEVSAPLDMGLNFHFYCEEYSKFHISSNGYILFNDRNGSTPAAQHLPNADVPNNLIALAWGDLFCPPPGPNGAIDCYRYKTFGTAPNRNLKIYFATAAYSTATGYPPSIYGYITLFETTNIIEIHLITTYDKSSAPYTMGIENYDGSKSMAVPGKNAQPWGYTYNQSYRFTPTNNITYTWTPTPIADFNTLTPLVDPTTTTTYTVNANNGTCISNDEVKVTIDCGILPVTIQSIKATLLTSSVLISFTVYEEDEAATYFIERSIDGIHWDRLTNFKGTNSGGEKTYGWTDHYPSEGANYYRLFIKENNKGYYSSVESVSTKNNSIATVIPNPFSDAITISLNEVTMEEATIILSDLTGKKLNEIKIKSEEVLHLGNSLSPGMYMLTISTESKTETVRIIKK